MVNEIDPNDRRIPNMKKIKLKVPIFTENYFITVEITKGELPKRGEGGYRGRAYNKFPDNNPLIILSGDFPYSEALATVAHEASHCMDYIEDYLGLSDPSGEFHAHGIGAVMRAVGKLIKIK